MSLAVLVIANLLLNAGCSFIAGLVLVTIVTWAFRVGATRLKLLLLSLPFVKIVWDLFYGIPANSYLFTSIDPWRLPPGHRSLFMGAGLSYFGPILNLGFSLLDDVTGREYSISLPDFFLSWVAHVTPRAPIYILAGIASVSMLLIARRIVEGRRFVRTLSGDTSRALVGLMRVGRRLVPVYRSEMFRGTPFTGGVFRPYVVFPSETLTALSRAEYGAVLAHELAHVRYHDLLCTLLVQTMGDIFWFVPGYRALSRRIDRAREILADRAAVESGAAPCDLASALLALKAVESPRETLLLYSAFLRTPSLLKARVMELTRPECAKPPRWGWNTTLGRLVITFWTVGGVLFARLGGNH